MSEAKELLRDFTAYCEAHPSERFWQALRNWSGQNFIMASSSKDFGKHPEGLRDTFYWRGKDGYHAAD